jgi:capsule polysaccharide export protein KpsC/LpsZ
LQGRERLRRMLRGSSEFEEADRINFLRERKLVRQRTLWAWRERLGLLRYAQADWDEPYIYLALQNGIDVKLTVRNPAFVEQHALATMVANAMPPGVTLYVKEHPNHPGAYDYRALQALATRANVKLIHPYTDNMTLIKKAKAVVTISSTAGWEAFVNKIPVVSLGSNFYNLSRLVFCMRHPNELARHLRDAVHAGSEMYDRRSREWAHFILSVLKTCHPGSTFGYRNVFGSMKKVDNRINGEAMARGIAAKLDADFRPKNAAQRAVAEPALGRA